MNDLTHDSGGVPWSGRELTGTGFDGDQGGADVDLLAALASPQDELGLMRAVARARLLVPVVAMPADLSTAEDSTDMAVVTLTAVDGQRVFPVFSSVDTLSDWDANARPSPVTSARAAQGAVSERCDVMLLDCGSDHERILRPSMVWALAQQREWLPAHADPFLGSAFERATTEEDDVLECILEADPSDPGVLRVVLGLRAGLDSAGVQALATRIGERIATDGEARARIDGIAFTIRHA